MRIICKRKKERSQTVIPTIIQNINITEVVLTDI